ncbi:MAG: aminotransferase class I/II-fold pyridoxal phosphate-dependent enzyme [Anaerolineales bacterium]|nr:aminotransferase class I/II-fold pyridoxal phosphate-dependent enzyme [Chloroflexota bacterium]MBL6980463.1 aminotransferase class I/II-fold pyridoxal phosphate-dependent enzyme [Anaerolineales bacterium]
MKLPKKLNPNFFATLNEKIADLKSAGADIIRLDIGSPDLPPAPHIVEALNRGASCSISHGYQSHRGTSALREAWGEMYQRVFDVSLNPDKDIQPLLGSKEGVFHLSLALLDPGDLVLVPDPGYQTYAQGALFAGADLFTIPLLPENDFLPDLSTIPVQAAQRAKILWLNYPNNPTTATASLDFFVEAVDFCRQFNILLCHDAAYTQVTFNDCRAPSVLQIPGAKEIAIEFNTLSKSHNMAGWRSGVAVGQAEALAALLNIKTHADSGHFLPITEASVAALIGDQSWLAERNAIYQVRRDVVVSALRDMGFSHQVPEASLYVWCPLQDGTTADQFVLHLLENAHVSLAPGTVFGGYGEGFVRISLVQPVERITEAMERIRNKLQVAR